MNLEEFGPDAKDEMSPSDYAKYCMEKFYEYRILAADPTITDAARKLYGEKAMDYYERAQAAIDEIESTNQESDLSPEDQAMIDKYEDEEANREVPRDYASMYENETKNNKMENINLNKNNKMENINLNRWAKLAGINESIDPSKLKEYHEFLLNIGGYDLAGDYNEMASHANQYDSFEDFVKDEVKVLDDPETVGLITAKYL